MKKCIICSKPLVNVHHNVTMCSEECKEIHNKNKKEIQLQKMIKESHEKYTDLYTYVECKICGLRGADIGNHIIKIHDMTIEDYRKKFNVKTIKSKEQCDRVKGENNPGYQHGGKFSIFSDKFIHNDGSDEFKAKQETIKKQSYDNSLGKDENRSNKVEYWLTKGYSKEEAIKKVSERQNTFSLSKNIEKHGEVDGFKIWQERQEKWQNTLDAKSDEEKADINKRKSSFTLLFSDDNSSIFYILKLKDDTIKIGVTTKSIRERYKKDMELVNKIIINSSINMRKGFVIEQIMKKKFDEFSIKKENSLLERGYTENFNITEEYVISVYNELMKTDNLYEEFIKYYPKLANVDLEEMFNENDLIKIDTNKLLNSDNKKFDLDYYTSRGLTLEEAKIALSNRQSTFSLKKCVAQHGLEKGFELWKDRQGLWQRTLNSKSDEEKKLINSKKVANFNYKHLMSLKETDGVNGLLYVIRLTNGHIKIGISTKNSVAERYSNNNYYISETIKEINYNLYLLYILERCLVDRFQDYMIDKDEMINHVFGYTETFKDLDSNRIINTIDKYFDSLKEI